MEQERVHCENCGLHEGYKFGTKVEGDVDYYLCPVKEGRSWVCAECYIRLMIKHDELDEVQRYIREDLREERARKLHEEVFLKKEA